MKVKELLNILKDFNPDTRVVLGKDYELNHLYSEIFVEVFEFEDGDTDFSDNVGYLSVDELKKVKTVVISGQGEYLPERN
jgi:hypothetical protein